MSSTTQLFILSVISRNLNYCESYANSCVFVSCDLCRLRLIWDAGSVLIALKRPRRIFCIYLCLVSWEDRNAFPGALHPQRPVQDCLKTAPLSNICNLVSLVAGRVRRSHPGIWQQTTHSSRVAPHKSVGPVATGALSLYRRRQAEECTEIVLLKSEDFKTSIVTEFWATENFRQNTKTSQFLL
jgi:hypothetical protein